MMLAAIFRRLFFSALFFLWFAGAGLAVASGEAQEKSPSREPGVEALCAYESGDFFRARDIWQKLAESGDGQAMNNLGVLYDQGKGLEEDTGRAAHWFERAARAGHPAGMSNYGRMLESGRGIAENPREAARWFEMAAREGQPEAQYNLGLLYEQGRGVGQDDRTAAAWYSRAAAQQQVDALARLGHCYRMGKGVPRDSARATLLLYAAAMNGHARAVKELEELSAEVSKRPPAMFFGQKLDSADRGSMRAALHGAGVSVVREDDSFICDIYDARGLIQGAGEMAACYAPGEPAPVGFVKIDYDAPTAVTANNIARMLEERFGKPSAEEGGDDRLWNLGSVLVALRYMPTRKLLSLMYMVPGTYHLTRQSQASKP
ncbi:MAG: sel1 repeat family protein [Desulfovibrio sp.]|jgi:TPR repeat protein|nr:sel1 repeat family protein [Desulfovibrio sp.]